jgi:hypothetical protein
LLLLSPTARSSIWAARGTSFPAECFSDATKGCHQLRIPSPNGQNFVEISYRKVFIGNHDFVMGVNLRVIDSHGIGRNIYARGFVEQEILWSPDSNSLFINGSDGGEGQDYVTVYRVGEMRAQLLNVLAAQKELMKSFPPCKAKYADPDVCESFAQHPDEINVLAIDWTHNSSAIVVMAEMPCSSIVGGIMCQVHGYEIEASNGKILRRMNARQFKELWQKSMGWTFHVPDPPEYQTGNN